MSFLYDFIFFIFALVSIPKFLIRLNQAKSSKQLIGQRFGFFSDSLKAKFSGKKVVWLHAVSVGEVNAAREWIKRFLNEYSEWTIALSTTTPTGQSVAESLITPSPLSSPPERGRGQGEWVVAESLDRGKGEGVEADRLIVFYAPFDLSFVVKRVLQVLNPKIILLMETEIWPNLIGQAHRAGIPIGIINGRISPRSFKRYQWVNSWLSSILNKLSFCLVQSERDHSYFQQLGLAKEKLVSTGNMKFDLNGQVPEDFVHAYKIFSGGVTDSATLKPGTTSNASFFIGGSTHWGEEKILLSVFKRLQPDFQNLKLILAPRHPEHLSKVEDAIKQFHFRYCLYSEIASGRPHMASPRNDSRQGLNLAYYNDTVIARRPKADEAISEYDVLLVDRMGVLASLYSIADLVFMGGSFVKRGGQNPIEAARFQKPILHGPNVANFHDVYRVLDERNAAVLTVSEEELYQQSKKLLERPDLRKEMGAQAWASIQSMKGATARTLSYLAPLL